MRRTLQCAGIGTLVLFAIGCARTEGTGTASTQANANPSSLSLNSTSVALKGSDTMVVLGQRWAESYMKAKPGVSVQVTGGGSGTGIAALINASTDICESSRPMKDKEKADLKAKRQVEAVEFKVALDALAIYVNDKNGIKELSLPALSKVYRGEIKNWKELGGSDHAIILYGRENSSGTYGYFKEHVLENKDFAASVQTLAGTSAVANAVKGDAFGIGYGGIAYAAGIRAVNVKKDETASAIAPNLQNAQDGTYPLSRFLYFYTAGTPTGQSKALIDWVQSAEGQVIIADVGYYPLPK